jgi:DNA-binding response OmpR family regulator
MNTTNTPTRLLVIDDEKGLRDMMTYTFRRLNFEVTAAENGEVGVSAALAGDFDVVLCDIMMPGMNGIAVLEILKRERPALEIIVVTGFPSDETYARARELGAYEYVAKPYDLLALRTLLESAASRKRKNSSPK